MERIAVPFFRPRIGEAEEQEVLATLRSGWLTTGDRCRRFEEAFASYLGVGHALALNSCTAALHLAMDAVGLGRGDIVLVPTHTFAATAEVVRYFDAMPVFVDCEPAAMTMDPERARAVLRAVEEGRWKDAGLPKRPRRPNGHAKRKSGPAVRAITSVHYAGQMADAFALGALAREAGAAYVEDAAHTLPAQARRDGAAPWRTVGTTADITCFSFYANKCITTGEGGMVATDDPERAKRMRCLSLHGLSWNTWTRETSEGPTRYPEVVAPGFKYNMSDVTAAIGIHQLARAEEFLQARRRIANRYAEAFADLEAIETPVELADRRHAWHLYVIRLRLEQLSIDREAFLAEMRARGIQCAVHWLPLHLHAYYRETYGYRAEDFPVATSLWRRIVSLPIYPGMREEEREAVVNAVREVAQRFAG